MARSASPVRLNRKKAVTTVMQVIAIVAATSRPAGISTPYTSSGSDGIGSGMAPGMAPNTREVAPRIHEPRPRVTMIREISGRPTMWRRTSRLKARAPTTMPADAAPMALASPSPAAWIPVATSRAPSIASSPSAKLTAPDAL
jgi:hypothetical protein